MVNVNAPFGLRAVGELGSNIQNGGTTEYNILPGLATQIYKGDLVQILAANGTIQQSAAGNADCLGVFNGCLYDDPTTQKPTWSNYYAGSITPANSEDVQAFVYDNPFQIYRCASDAQVASTVAGAHEVIFETFGFNTTAGSTATGKSSATLDIGSTHATNDSWKLLGLAEDPENEDLTAAYCSVNVIQNLNEIIDST